MATQFKSDHSAERVSSEVELLNYDNATNTRIQIYRNQVGVDATLSPVLSFRGNIGALNLITEGGVNPLASGASAFDTSASSSLVDWIGDAALTYRMLKNTTLQSDREPVDRTERGGFIVQTRYHCRQL